MRRLIRIFMTTKSVICGQGKLSVTSQLWRHLPNHARNCRFCVLYGIRETSHHGYNVNPGIASKRRKSCHSIAPDTSSKYKHLRCRDDMTTSVQDGLYIVKSCLQMIRSEVVSNETFIFVTDKIGKDISLGTKLVCDNLFSLKHTHT